MAYTAKTFALPELKGLSKKQIDVHLALYEGYVKHVNLINEKITSLKEADAEGNAFVINELRRRYGFEWDGMRMHEYYFEQFEGGPQASDAQLQGVVGTKYGSWEGFIGHLKEVCGMRGIGWCVVYFDPRAQVVQTVFVADHELGQLAGLPVLLAIDLWEHAYMVDYVPAEKKTYVEAFLENVNWSVVGERLSQASR